MVTDMTVGKPARILWAFSLPILCSSIFQQLYNMADSVVAGRFAGEDALAAVGASFPVTMIFMAVALGCSVGCSVVISQLFGGRLYREMKTAVSTSFIAILTLSVVLTVLALIFCSPLMVLLNTPQNIFSDSVLYLRIYILGLLFLFLYNISTGVFTALGDSKTPLYLLIASSVGNILLDLLFVAVFQMGVGGVAWATFLAQGAASVLACLVLFKRLKKIEAPGKTKVFSFPMLKRISIIAVPSILQQSFISVGNLCIQGLINSYGSAVIAGYSAAVKLNTFSLTSFTALGNGLSSFTAQNIGADKPGRVKQGFRSGIIMAMCVALPFAVLFFFFGPQMVGLFLDESSVQAVSAGCRFLTIVSPFYFLIAAKLMADGVLRGAGAMVPFMITTFTDLVLRVVLAFVLNGALGTDGIWISWPAGWAVASVMSLVFYFTGIWKPRRSLGGDPEPMDNGG